MADLALGSTVLFLDFDGVLHPRGGAVAGERFCKKAMLEGLLREPDLQHVLIVISSTWREVYPLRRLAQIFSDDIRHRVIDTTPVLGGDAPDFLRYREIRAWLNLHPAVSRWVALDDAVDDFPHGLRASGISTNPDVGLGDLELSKLRARLTAS